MDAPKCGEFEVEKEEILKNVKSCMKCPVEFKVLSHKDRDSFPKGNLSGVKEGTRAFTPIGEKRLSCNIYREKTE